METDPRMTGFHPTKQYSLVGPDGESAPRYATRSLTDLDLADELLAELEKLKTGEHNEGWLEALRVEQKRRANA
jgi:hypothetical protein